MTDTTLETIESGLWNAMEKTDDAEVRFELRSALQRLVLLEQSMPECTATEEVEVAD